MKCWQFIHQAGYLIIILKWTETGAEEEIGLDMDQDMANQGYGPGTNWSQENTLIILIKIALMLLVAIHSGFLL